QISSLFGAHPAACTVALRPRAACRINQLTDQDMNEPSTSSRRRRLGRGKIAVAVIAVALVGFGAWKYFAGGEEEPEYSTATITIGDIEDLVTATGTLEPRDKVDVGAQVSGQIEKIFVEVGDVVKAGDILAKIDATTAIAR